MSKVGLICYFIVFITAYNDIGVVCTCRPKLDPPLVKELYPTMGGGFGYIRCYVDTLLCNDTQTIIYHYCGNSGDYNCRPVYSYSFGNHSENKYGDDRVSRYTYKDEWFGLRVVRVGLRDDGIWKCFIVSGDEVYGGTVTNVTVSVNIREDDVTVAPLTGKTPALQKVNFTCETDGIRPPWEIIWKIDGADYHGVQINTRNEDYFDTWKIHNTLEMVFSHIRPVRASCEIGINKWNSFAHVSYPFIINPVLEESIYHPSDEVKIGCARPVSFPAIEWRQNEVFIWESFSFTQTSSEVQGLFDHRNKTIAKYSELSWTLPSIQDGCSAIDKFAGVYDCVADPGNKDWDWDTTYYPRPREISIEYPPIFEYSGANTTVSAISGSNIVLECSCCASPPIAEYNWFKGDVYVGSTRTLLLQGVTERDFGQYTCIAANTIGATNMTFHVRTATSTKTYYKARTGDKIEMECPLCDGNEKECWWKLANGEEFKAHSYNIGVLTKEHYGQYSCISVFTSGKTWVTITLAQLKTTENDTDHVKTTPSVPDDIPQDKTHSLSSELIVVFAALGGIAVGLIVVVITLCIILSARKGRSKPNENTRSGIDSIKSISNGKISTHF